MRRELFEPDRGLQVRMVLVAVLTPLIVLAALAALFLVAPVQLKIGLGIALVVGVKAIVDARPPEAAPLGPGEEPELQAIVQRLCARIDLPVPEIVVEPERQPNSWVFGARRQRSRLHVTRGLLDLLDRDELEVVIAHELAHVAHRDAAVMTVVGGPGEALRSGSRRARGGWGFVWIGARVAAALGEASTIGTRSLSRHRELAADRTAASLTGRPAALISALHKISGRMALIPNQDLRLAAGRDAFNLVPTGEELTGLRGRFMSTHPPLEARIARLERLEQRLQTPGG